MVPMKQITVFFIFVTIFLTIIHARRHHQSIDDDYYFGDRSYLRNSEGEENIDDDDQLDANIFYYRPAVRHHIAHFCPDLDKARTCIWGCMKKGKPAFCGKDHVCYCGHKYHSNQGKDPKQNLMNFQDLYEKYFGPNTNLNDRDTTRSPDGAKKTEESEENESKPDSEETGEHTDKKDYSNQSN